MPSYSQVKLFLADTGVTGTSTHTASGHVVTVSDVADFGAFVRPTQIENVKVKIKTVPGDAATALANMVFLNGTNTFATLAVGTAADESFLSATMQPSNARFAADAEPTLNIITTGTASSTTGVTQGVYEIWFEM